MSLFTTLSRVMQQQGDKLNVAIETLSGGSDPKLRLLITPRLAPASAEAGAQEVAYRNALRQPLIVTGTAEECEAQLDGHIGSYQRHLDDAKESLKRMEESRSKAERTTSQKPASKGKGKGKGKGTSKASDAENEGEPEAKQATTPEAPGPETAGPAGIGGF